MFGAIFLPCFHLQAALRWREEWWAEPVALVDAMTNRGTVLECTPVAAQEGVEIGMASIQAMARCSGVRLVPREVEQERNVMAALLEISGSLSPDVEMAGEGICTVDVRRAVVADWARWGQAVVERLEELQLRGRVGVAPNPDLALLVARRAEPVLVVRNPATFLADLAIARVDPPPELLGILRDWGINHLGELLQVPKSELVERLGPAAGMLWQQAAGRSERLLRIVRMPEELGECMDFEHEVDTVEPLLFVLRRFVDQLSRRLENSYRVAARMRLVFPLENGTEYERWLMIPAPTAEAERLFRILSTHLDGLQLEQRPTGVRLTIEPTIPENDQLRLFEAPLRDPNGFGETLARLKALLGVERVGVSHVIDTHRPDSYEMLEPQFGRIREGNEKAGQQVPVVGLPLRRYRPPLPAQVHLHRDVPQYVFSEKAYGEVIDANGPYRVSGEWWDGHRWGMEEWDVEMPEGDLYRLSKKDSSWRVEGCYDAGLC